MRSKVCLNAARNSIFTAMLLRMCIGHQGDMLAGRRQAFLRNLFHVREHPDTPGNLPLQCRRRRGPVP